MPPTPSPSSVLNEVVGGNSAPWWGVPVIAGSFLLLGAVLGFVFNRLQDKKRAEREQRTRWDDNVLAHTSRVVFLVIELIRDATDHEVAVERVAKSMAAGMKPGDPVTQTKISQETLDKLMSTYESLSIELVAMRLVTTSAIRARAKVIQQGSFLMLTAPDLKQIDAEAANLRKASEALESAVREHFGIS